MKRLSSIALILFLGCSLNVTKAQEATLERAHTLLKQGDYKEAITAFTALLQKDGKDREAQLGLVRAMIETGDYTNAEKKTKEFLAIAPDARLRTLLGEVELKTGRYADAAAEFERARQNEKGVVWLRAGFGRARALLAQGKEDEAHALLSEFIRYYNDNDPDAAEELTLIARGLVELEKYQDANDLFIDARDEDATFADAFIAQGELFNKKYIYADAASLFQDALKINEHSADAQIGLAESMKLTSSEATNTAIERALAVNPNHVSALTMRAWLNLASDRPDAAMQAVERALSVNPNAIEALAMRAAIFYATDRKSDLEATTKRALAINPRAGEFFSTLAYFAVITRRYQEAVDFGRRAVDLAPRLWSARTELGIQLLRVGKLAEGRAELDKAFENDAFNVWAKNTLDLLDSVAEYPDAVRGPFIIKASPSESPVLAAYAADLLEEAHKKLAEKYRFTPRAPMLVEIYENHEDFAVRALGLPGLGALGVCFGQVIAMDSPSARPPGEFNWGSTLWHEFMHIISLQMTDHRIPRWLSEGLSVYEERRARPGWGDKFSIPNLRAIAAGRFVKLDDLDAAFLRPTAPDQVPLAYFQASLVCDFIDEKYGFDKMLQILAAYKEGAKTPDVFKRALAISTSDFDKAFFEWLNQKTQPLIDAIGTGPVAAASGQPPAKEALEAIVKAKPNDYFARLRLGTMYKSEKQDDLALEHLRRAAEVFPYYGGEGNPHGLIADILEARGQKAEAAAALETLTRFTETNVEVFKKLAQLRAELGDRVGARNALLTSFYIYPFEASLHKLAGDIYLEQGSAGEAVREFRVVLALEPPDLAEAHYDLARSLDAAGNRVEAKREVLRSLEIAPGFEKAQELLLKLRGGS